MAAVNPYASASKIREVDDLVDNEWPSDDDVNDDFLEELCEDWANPEIDSILGLSCGVPFEAGSIPVLIQNQAADLTAARILSGKVAGFSGGVDPEKATRLREDAIETLEKIATGKRDVVGITRSTTGRAVTTLERPYVRPDEEDIVGRNELDWGAGGKPETRDSDNAVYN